MDTIGSLPAGLYEMKIDEFKGEVDRRTFVVSFHERSFDDIRQLDDGRDDETAFAAVARASELQAELYDLMVRPFVKVSVDATLAELSRQLHPLRLQRALVSSQNPLVKPIVQLAEMVKSDRKPAGPDNPFVQMEQAWADLFEQSIDLWRDTRDAWYETAFYSLWGTP